MIHVTSSRDIFPSPAPNGQISSYTEEFQCLELINKEARLNDNVEDNVSNLELDDVQSSASEKKLVISDISRIKYTEMEIFVMGNDKPITKSLPMVYGQTLIDIGIFEVYLANLPVSEL